MSCRILTVVGARPQFIKAAAVSRVLRRRADVFQETILHTGQHYDEAMSDVFFDELDIPRPARNLGIGGGSHGEMTGRMLAQIEAVLFEERPDWVLVYGDTNSTIAGALAAAKLHIPVAHVEAGLRSFNRRMPEEVNRVLTDHVSTLLFCPTDAAVKNLCAEGVLNGVHQVGDVMFDVALHYRDIAFRNSNVLSSLGLDAGHYALATCHRAENTDDPHRLASIVGALNTIASELPVVMPLHPRTRQALHRYGISPGSLRIVEPVGYLDMVRIEQSAAVILTDSGGVQKEAFFFGVPCLTLRDETEWGETVATGWNVLCGADGARILGAWGRLSTMRREPSRPYGDGDAAEHIADFLANENGSRMRT